MALCKDCGKAYDRKFDWAVRCFDCYKIFKAKCEPRTEYLTKEVLIERPEYQQFKSKLKTLISLCHPDKHGGSATALETTQWLIGIYKK